MREVDWGYWTRHYTDLIWRKKWFIATAGPLVAAGWMMYAFKFNNPKPELMAEAIIGFDQPQQVSAVQDVGSTVNGKVELLQSRTFLTGVVDKLGLRLRVINEPRHSVFDSVTVAEDATEGYYELTPRAGSSGEYTVTVTNSALGYSSKVVARGSLADLDTIGFAGVHVRCSRSYRQAPATVSFEVVSMRDAVDDLVRRITLNRETIPQGFVKVALAGTDYELMAQTVNTMADTFIAQNLHMRKRRTAEVIDILDKQLEKATEQLARSEAAMRQFREQHPTVGLSQTASLSVENAMNLETANIQDQLALDDARALRRQFRNATGEDRQLIIGEMLSFLEANGIPAASSMRMEYSQIVEQLMDLRSNYAQQHPIIREQHAKMKVIGRRADDALQDFIGRVSDRIEMHEDKIAEYTGKLRGLPSKELRLAKLQRQSQIASEIHGMVQSRYNQAKIANAVEVPDMFVMDYAMPPIPPPDSVTIILQLMMGVFLGMVAGFGPVVFTDLVDKTARTQQEFMRLVDLPVLETVPVIEFDAKKRKPNAGDEKPERQVDEKLTTADYAPHYVNEIYRSLRTKLLLGMHEAEHKGLVVTSLEMDEGKSLTAANVAITMAQRQLGTILVDADLRRGVQHTTFGLDKGRGLADLLVPEAAVTAERIAELTQATHVPNLSLISAGMNVPNPLELLSSEEFKALMVVLKKKYEVIIMDTPPLGVASDAVVLTQHAEQCLLVVRAGKTNTVDLRKKLEEYPMLHDKVTGAVLNLAPIDRRLKYYKYSNYNY